MITDFLQGQKDCKNGKPHKDGMSEDYDRGYNYQYWIEQKKTAESEYGQSQRA